MDKILHLTLFREFFDKILSGEKVEEYRDKKEYWEKRLFENRSPKEYDYIIFKNGYSKDAPEMKVEWKGLREDNERYTILLGKVVETKNVEHSAGKDVHFLEIEDKLFNSEKRKREEDEKDLC